MRGDGRRVEASRVIARRATDFLIARISHVLNELEAGSDEDARNGEHRLAVLLGAWRTARGLEAGRQDERAGTSSGGCEDPRAIWRDRLMLDPEDAAGPPLIRGTRVTTAQVVSLVLDGWSWDRIRRTYPGLTTDDIRACLSYSVEESGAGAVVRG